MFIWKLQSWIHNKIYQYFDKQNTITLNKFEPTKKKKNNCHLVIFNDLFYLLCDYLFFYPCWWVWDSKLILRLLNGLHQMNRLHNIMCTEIINSDIMRGQNIKLICINVLHDSDIHTMLWGIPFNLTSIPS